MSLVPKNYIMYRPIVNAGSVTVNTLYESAEIPLNADNAQLELKRELIRR